MFHSGNWAFLAASGYFTYNPSWRKALCSALFCRKLTHLFLLFLLQLLLFVLLLPSFSLIITQVTILNTIRKLMYFPCWKWSIRATPKCSFREEFDQVKTRKSTHSPASVVESLPSPAEVSSLVCLENKQAEKNEKDVAMIFTVWAFVISVVSSCDQDFPPGQHLHQQLVRPSHHLQCEHKLVELWHLNLLGYLFSMCEALTLSWKSTTGVLLLFVLRETHNKG